MKIVFASDTHSKHAQITQAIIAAKAEVLVHCGDFSDVEFDLATQRFVRVGDTSGVASFAEWCAMLVRKSYVRHVVTIAGNHDLRLDKTFPDVASTFPDLPDRCRKLLDVPGVSYLEDESLSLFGVTFYGSPWTPRFYDWGFQINHPQHDQYIAEQIPDDVDVLITHGPPYGILDLCDDGRRVGSKALRERADHRDRGQPQVHAFGHIHHSYGMELRNGVLYVNASTCTEPPQRPTNPPIVLELR